MRSEVQRDAVTVRNRDGIESEAKQNRGSHRSQAATPGRHHRLGQARRLTPTRTIAMAATASLALAGSVLLLESPGSAAPQPTLTVLATDAMSRTVPSGLGIADKGGAYAVSSPARSSVSGGVGKLVLSGPGSAVEAALPVSSGDTRMRTTFSPSVVPTVGGGVYLEQELRRVSAGSAYRSRVRILPGGKALLGFSELVGGSERLLGGEKTLPFAVSAGQKVVLETEVTGSAPVHLTSRAWLVGASTPDWQQSFDDSAASRITASAGVGIWAYVSSGAKSGLTASADDLSVWKVSYGAPAPSSSGKTTPPASSSHSSTPPPPSSSAPPTSSPTSQAPPPPAGTDPTQAGSAVVGSTAYPVPSGAIFVSPTGNDSAAGSVSNPLRTIGHAVAVAPSGSTIVLRGGLYHETVEIPANKTLTVQSYPNEAAWLEGRSPVTDWTKKGTTWVHSGWTTQFDSTAGYNAAQGANTSAGWGFVNPAYPMASHPDQVWIGNTALKQVAAGSPVAAGQFAVDYNAKTITVGSDPNADTTRASDLPLALTVRSAHSVIRGIGVRGYGTPIPNLGTVRMIGVGDLMENVVVTSTASTGIAAIGTGQTYRHISLLDNGMLGMVGNYADGLTIDSALAQGNNAEHFNGAPVAGGIKITRTRGVSVTNSVSRDNLATGLWFDESCYDVTAANNDLIDNGSHGMSLEISATAKILNNMVTGNANDGLKINDSADVQIWNNTIGGNGRGIELVQDLRRGARLSDPGHDPRQKLPDPTETWLVGDVTIANNIIAEGRDYSVYARDYSGDRAAGDMKLTFEGNAWETPGNGQPAQIVWGGPGNSSPRVFTTVTGLTAATGLGSTDVSEAIKIPLQRGMAVPGHPATPGAGNQALARSATAARIGAYSARPSQQPVPARVNAQRGGPRAGPILCVAA